MALFDVSILDGKPNLDYPGSDFISWSIALLLPVEKFKSSLRCPITKKSLDLEPDAILSRPQVDNVRYFYLDGTPILIDFEKSIFELDAIKEQKPVVKRNWSGIYLNLFKSILFPTSPVTKRNVSKIWQLLLNGTKKKRVLIIGGGKIGQGMERFYTSDACELVSLDVYSSDHTNLIADAHNIPFKANTFDLIVIQAVLEHVLEPSLVVREIHRVLRENGHIYAETPFMQHVHEGAYDFSRFTETGHRHLFSIFQCLDSGATAGIGHQVLWTIEHFFRAVFRSRKIGKIAKVFFFWVQYLDLATSSEYNVDAACGVFFIGKKSTIKQSASDIVRQYKGAQKT